MENKKYSITVRPDYKVKNLEIPYS